MSEAMRQVQQELGDEAIIVTTREEPSGWVKITAAVEQLPEPQVKPTAATKKKDEGLDPDTIMEMITDTMLKHRVPAAVGDKVISRAMTVASGDPKQTLAAALKKVFSFNEPSQAKKQKPVILVGPPGAGKTLMAAKMAARAVLEGQSVAVITTDIARAGGVEQLSSFLNILSLPLLQAETQKELKAALAKSAKASQVIVDTGGLNPFDPQEMKALARLIHTEEMVPTLVLPAGTDAEESAEIAMTFEILGVKRLIPTRLDFSRRLGGILSAADRAHLAFMEASHTPQVADGILRLTPDALANLLMPHSPKKR